MARVLGYICTGSYADGSAPIGKRVAARHGDTVDVTAAGIAVNGRPIPNTRTLRTDSDGRSLPHLTHGRYLVSTDEVWLLSTHSTRSFDSRYFGPVRSDLIVNRVRPVFVLH